jgi:hypothetical protein
MTKFRKLAIAAAVASAGLLPVASHAVLIDGVSFTAGDQFIATTIWESVLTLSTQSLAGVGRINSVDCTSFCGGTTWISGQNDTQLTYYFQGYSVLAWYDTTGAAHLAGDEGGGSNSFANAQAIDFTGGTVKLYSDRVSTGTNLNPTGTFNAAADVASATDGNLWLSYEGATTSVIDPGLGLRTGTLISSATGINNVHATGTGFGYLDVAALGGLAGNNFDTNSFNIGGVVTDAKLTSSFSSGNCGAWPLCGTADVKTAAIPEPGSLALIGLGLAGLAGSVRRKSAKKA